MIRLLDLILSITILLLTSPILALFSLLIFLQDFSTPFYISTRVGKFGKDFQLIKLRSMRLNNDINLVSTSNNDARITSIGKLIRKLKLDEFAQFINVLINDMSIVGPRPQVRSGGTDLYTHQEKTLLNYKPGITDIASIVFSDEGDILSNSKNPNRDYNTLIRPWKSRLAVILSKHLSVKLYFYVIILTVINAIFRPLALKLVGNLIYRITSDEQLKILCYRANTLVPTNLYGSNEIYRD